MTVASDWAPYPEEIKMLPIGTVELAVTVPERWQVVMGAAGRTEQEVELSALQQQGVPLYKRKGGGGTVLLGPGTLVVTVQAGVVHTFRNKAYFEAINKALMEVFGLWKRLNYHQRGISDIAVGDLKIVGSSIFRRRSCLLFQASILVDLDLVLMERLLKHPPREPDYRKGRSHGAFVTSLRELGIEAPMETLATSLSQELPERLKAYLKEVDDSYEF